MTGMGRSVVVIAPANYFRMALQRYLQRLGFDVRVAADLGEAVAEARRVEASLFVLDLNQTVALADLELLRHLSTSGSLIYVAENGKRALIERLAIHTAGLC